MLVDVDEPPGRAGSKREPDGFDDCRKDDADDWPDDDDPPGRAGSKREPEGLEDWPYDEDDPPGRAGSNLEPEGLLDWPYDEVDCPYDDEEPPGRAGSNREPDGLVSGRAGSKRAAPPLLPPVPLLPRAIRFGGRPVGIAEPGRCMPKDLYDATGRRKSAPPLPPLHALSR